MAEVRLNPTIKQQWLDALRSDEYTQGREFLNNNGNFCCLGVLCDIHSKETGTPWNTQPNEKDLMVYLGHRGDPPGAVSKWAYDFKNQIIGSVWTLKYDGNECDLVKLNDRVGLNFEQIADLIEEQL